VNTGNYSTAIELFSELLKTNPRVVAAYLGRGTAYALSGSIDKVLAGKQKKPENKNKNKQNKKKQKKTCNLFVLFMKAIVDFSAGIEVDKNCVDAWKRRGHVRKITAKKKPKKWGEGERK
jgi:tetratricopeptide (TPR) repeat protein